MGFIGPVYITGQPVDSVLVLHTIVKNEKNVSILEFEVLLILDPRLFTKL